MTPNNLLAHFTYSKDFWNLYVDTERKNKKEDNFYFGAAITIICTAGLMFFRNTTFLVALLFAIPFAILIPWLRQKISYKYLEKNIQNPEVKIYDTFLRINHQTIEFKNDQRRLKNIKLIETANHLFLLEFDIQWLTRKGPTNDEYRIPIPSEKIEEAQKIISILTS
ncbi:MAG: hypothetical protein HC798_02155 [Polaribacter sp.]|nr:hypothetical protein [Polaribacter sp.]